MAPRTPTPTANMHRGTDHSGAINPCRIPLVPHASPTPMRLQPVSAPRPCKVPSGGANVASYMQGEGNCMAPRPTTPTAHMHRGTDHSGGINPCRILLVPHASPTPTRLEPVRHQGHAKCRQGGPMLLHTCKEKAIAWPHVRHLPRLTYAGGRTTPVGSTPAESY